MSKSFDDYDEEELVDVDAKLFSETPDAYCVTIDDDKFGKEAPRYWIPKTLVRNNEDGTFTMPGWLAKDKGLI